MMEIMILYMSFFGKIKINGAALKALTYKGEGFGGDNESDDRGIEGNFSSIRGFTNTISKKNGYANGKWMMNTRTSMAERDDVIRRTAYVSDINHQSQQPTEARFVEDCTTCK